MMKSEKWLKGRNALVTGFAFAGFALAGACTTDGAAGGDTADEPIAKVALADGSEVSFFEPSPGAIFVEQEGPRGFAPVTESTRSPLDLYRSLAPGKAAPAALIDAQARSGVRGDVTTGPAATAVPPVASLTNSDFVNLFCGGSWDSLLCRTDLHGGISKSYSSTDEAIWTVCADVGNVTLKIVWDGDLYKDHDVLAGTCYSIHKTTSIFSAPPSSFQVYNVASSDQYDVSVRVNF